MKHVKSNKEDDEIDNDKKWQVRYVRYAKSISSEDWLGDNINKRACDKNLLCKLYFIAQVKIT